jgi:hypothetical protein
MKILSVVGARPQFVKLAPIDHALRGRAEHVIVHTGQHYDPLMSDVFFRDLGISAPDVNLEVGSGPHGAQTGAMLAGLEAAFLEHRPDWVLVYGDTTSRPDCGRSTAGCPRSTTGCSPITPPTSCSHRRPSRCGTSSTRGSRSAAGSSATS